MQCGGYKAVMSMTRKIFRALIILLAVMLSATKSFSAEAQKETAKHFIAVFDLEAIGLADKDLCLPMTNIIRNEIIKAGRYDLLDRNAMKKILHDQMFPVSGCLTGECIVEIGEALAVKKIITGTISTVGASCYVLFNLVDAGSGKIEYIYENKSVCKDYEMTNAFEGLSKKLLGDLDSIVKNSDVSKQDANSGKGKETMFTGPEAAKVSEDSRFVFYELAAKDKETKLFWSRDANIAGKSMSWSKAGDYIRQLNKQRYAGYNDWRLPNKEELETLVKYANSKGYEADVNGFLNEKGFFNAQTDSYWSSTTYDVITVYAWYVIMVNGKTGVGSKEFFGYVWPVRSGK